MISLFIWIQPARVWMFPFLRYFFNIVYPSHIKLEHKITARFYLFTVEPLAPYVVTTFLILHFCNCVYLSLFLYLSHVNGAEWNKSSCLVLSCPLHNGQLGDRRLACAEGVSARLRRESWNESKKKGMTGMTFFLAPALTFAQWLDWKRLLRRLTEVDRWLLKEIRLYLFFYLFIDWLIYLFIYLFIHSFINLWKIVHSTGVYFPYKEVYRWIIRYLDHNFFFFFFGLFQSIHSPDHS